jgi:hypothetical protein
MLWWGIDKTLEELFVWHPSSHGFAGNPPGKFKAVIGGASYGPNKTMALIGLYSMQYTIKFRPCE